MTERGPETKAGRKLLADWRNDPKELWTVERTIDAIRAIELEAYDWGWEDAASGPVGRDPIVGVAEPLPSKENQ